MDSDYLLPIDNRPLKFDEFENLSNQTIYVSATPGKYELEKSEGVIVEQLIRTNWTIRPYYQCSTI